MKKLFLAVLILGALPLSRSSQANEFTDVIDAFDNDNDDPFDINLSIGYERTYRSSLIRRESLTDSPHAWDYYAYRNMFEYTQATHVLDMGLEIGLYKDLSLTLGLPLVLNDSRKLTAHGDLQWKDHDADGQPDALLTLPFSSPERSGIDYFSVGLWWGILDQGRVDTQPNWTIFAEGRFGVGDPLKPACAPGSSTDDTIGCGGDGGISRGLNELHIGTRLSRRHGILDPYFGFSALLGFPKDGTQYSVGKYKGSINELPPIVASLDFGMEIIPWEAPEEERKLSIGIGAGGKYHSEGREYTQLFDALGSSQYFKNQAAVDFNGDGNQDSSNPGGLVDDYEWHEQRAQDETDGHPGLTDVENYASFYGKLFVMVQPAKYVKFRVGGLWGHETEHFITKTDQCQTGYIVGGVCQWPNYGHRPEIDTPGDRFRAEKTFLWTFFIDALAMF